MTNPNVMRGKLETEHIFPENFIIREKMRKLLIVEKEGTNEYDFKATKKRIKYAKKLLKEFKKELKEEQKRWKN